MGLIPSAIAATTANEARQPAKRMQPETSTNTVTIATLHEAEIQNTASL